MSSYRICFITDGDEIVTWNVQDLSIEDVQENSLFVLFIEFDEKRVGENYKVSDFDYVMTFPGHHDETATDQYSIFLAPLAAESVIENTASLVAVRKEFECEEYSRIVRSISSKQPEIDEIDAQYSCNEVVPRSFASDLDFDEHFCRELDCELCDEVIERRHAERNMARNLASQRPTIH